MQYLGGKHRIAKPLCEYLRTRLAGRLFVEPFCGALNVTAGMEGKRVASDASPYLFALYDALRKGWSPPDDVSEQTYDSVNSTRDPSDPMTAFVGYGCSFGGKFFGGYARGSEGRSYASNAKGSLRRKLSRCNGATIAHCDYRRLTPNAGCLVYCDPPYAETTGYSAVGSFDSGEFWQTVRDWSSTGATVLVSEYTAPADFICVWSHETRTDLHGAGRSGRLERLFEVAP